MNKLNTKHQSYLNPLCPGVTNSSRITKIRRDNGKISYERRDYESVDEKSLS